MQCMVAPLSTVKVGLRRLDCGVRVGVLNSNAVGLHASQTTSGWQKVTPNSIQ